MDRTAAIIAALGARGGLSREQARKALEATLEALGERLLESDARALAEALPAPLASAVTRRAQPAAFGAGELYATVARREGVKPGFGREHVQLVCGLLADCLDPLVLERIRGRVPAELAELLSHAPPAEPPPAHAAHRPRRTLSEGRPPQSSRPLSEARPGSEHPLSELKH